MRPLLGLMIAAGLMICGGAAAAEPEVMRSAAQAPTVEQLYLEGVRARQAGRPQQAIEILSRAVVAQPENSDVLLQRALALSDVGRLDEARADLSHVLRLAPDYTDARLALARIALREKHPAQAEDQAQQVLSSHPDNSEAWIVLGDSLREQRREPDAREAYERAVQLQPDSVAAQRLAVEQAPRFRLDINGSLSHLSNDLPHWREGAIRLAYAANERSTYSGGVDVSHRFGTTDTYIEGRIDHQFSSSLGAYAYVGGTPDAEFLPEVALGGGLSVRLHDMAGRNATFGTLDGRFARYVTGNVQSLNPGFVQYLVGDRIWLTGKWVNTWDERDHYLTGWSLRADWQAWDRMRFLVGYANAPESSDGVTVRTRAVYGGLAYDLNDRNSIQITGAHEKRDGLYDRNSVTVGLTVRF